MTQFPAADLRLVRRLEREYLRATAREERADDLATAQRLAAHSDRVARRLAAARDGITIEPPRTRRNLARGAFAALAAIGRTIERALRRADALRRATLAAAVKRTARKALRLARLALRRTVTAIVALVVSSPALALAHPGHAGHDAPDINVGGAVVLVGVTLGLAAHAWANWGPRRRLVATVDGGGPIAGGEPPSPEPEATSEPEWNGERLSPAPEAPIAPMAPYFTVRIPYCADPARVTEWHPTEPAGPFALLTRGAFRTLDAARTWARERLNGTAYSVARVAWDPATEADRLDVVYTSAPDHYTLTLADGRMVTGPIHGSGGTIPAGQHDRVQREIDRANDGDRLGIYEPAPGCASMHTPSGERLTIDLRGARLHR